MANAQSMKVDEAFLRQLSGYNRLTMLIRYCMPDNPLIICPHPFIYQLDDVAPKFPALKQYLQFWEREIEAQIESVTFAHAKLIKPAEFKAVALTTFLH